MAVGTESTTPEEGTSALLIRAEELYQRAVADPSGSRAEAEQLVERTRRASDKAALVAALRALAHAHRYLLEHDVSMALVDEAARVARRHRLHRPLGEALLSRGVLQHERGRTAQARQDLDRAAELLGATAGVEVDLQRAALAQNTGELARAADLYRTILRRDDLSPSVRTRVANNLGMIETTTGNHEAAARHLAMAARAARDVGPAYVAEVAQSQAWATVHAGRLADAVARFDEAAALWEKAALPLGELYTEYAEALLSLRLLPEAREQADRAMQMFEAQGVDLMAEDARLRAAELALAMGDGRDAEVLAEDTAASLQHQRRSDSRARARLVAVQARLLLGKARREDHTVAVRATGVLERAGIRQLAAEGWLAAGRVASATGRPSLAVDDWERAASLTPDTPVLARMTGHLARALVAQARGADNELLRACRRGLADLERHRSALPSTELRALASGHGAELSSLGLAAVRRHRSGAQVLEWMERTRASALSTIEPGPAGREGDELEALRAVQAEVTRARRADRAALPDLLARRAQLEVRIRRSTWTEHTPAASRGRRFSTTSLREALAGRTLIEYDMHDGRVVAAVVEPRRTRVVDVADRATVEAEIDELRSALHALNVCVPEMSASLHAAAADIVEHLGDLLVRPLALSDGDGVVVVPVGELQRVPWSALFDRPVSVAPSATLWMQSAAREDPDKPVVLAAGPGLDAAVPEVQALSADHTDVQVLTPPHSTVDGVKHALHGASLAHLACHGEVRADNPIFSSLQLCDGNLTLHEMDTAAAVPHRLVLAACDVGDSVAYPGNEVLGFIGTLLSRGTAGVVASTMLVLDERVTPMMLALHDRVRKGQTLADALYAARATLDRDDPKAYPAWCTFTAYGAG